MRKLLTRIKGQTARTTDNCVLTLKMSPLFCTTRTGWITWSREMLPPSSPDCNPLYYFTWSIVEIEVNKHPRNTLASLKAKILNVMTNTDREVIIPPSKKFWSRIVARVEANGNFEFLSNKCVGIMHVNLS
jgi:hypothetical protein